MTPPPPPSNLPALPSARTGSDLLFIPELFAHTQRVARIFAGSSLVPKHLQITSEKDEAKKIANCVVALVIARDMDEQPLMVMQNIYFSGDKFGWLTQYVIGRANRHKAFQTKIAWHVVLGDEDLEQPVMETVTDKDGTRERHAIGPHGLPLYHTKPGSLAFKRKIKTGYDEVERKVLYNHVDVELTAMTVWAYAINHSGQIARQRASMDMAVAEEWANNPKYSTMPEMMLQYRSAAFLVRLNAPEVMMGIPTADEVEDMDYAGELRPGTDGVYRVDTPPPRPARAHPADAPAPKPQPEIDPGSGEIHHPPVDDDDDAAEAEETAADADSRTDPAADGEPAVSGERIPTFLVHLVEGSTRASDWQRFYSDMMGAANTLAPHQMAALVDGHAEALKNMAKQSKILHTGLIQRITERSNATVVP